MAEFSHVPTVRKRDRIPVSPNIQSSGGARPGSRAWSVSML